MLATLAAFGAVAMTRFEFNQVHMGVRVGLTLYAPDRATAEKAGRAAFARFADLDRALSDYQIDSELNRLVRREPGVAVSVSVDLFRVLVQARRISILTEGAFDVTAGPLVQLWREARRAGRLPDPAALTAARQRVGFRHLDLDPMARTVTLRRGDLRLDLGGIAKGYACDEALRAIAREGVFSAMVEAGGDLAVSGPPPGRDGWVIAVRGHAEKFTLVHQALSTSGDSEQFVEVEGVRYSHVLDPRTGIGVTDRRQVTIIGGAGLLTDPLATAASVQADSVRRFPVRVYEVKG